MSTDGDYYRFVQPLKPLAFEVPTSNHYMIVGFVHDMTDYGGGASWSCAQCRARGAEATVDGAHRALRNHGVSHADDCHDPGDEDRQESP